MFDYHPYCVMKLKLHLRCLRDEPEGDGRESNEDGDVSERRVHALPERFLHPFCVQLDVPGAAAVVRAAIGGAPPVI